MVPAEGGSRRYRRRFRRGDFRRDVRRDVRARGTPPTRTRRAFAWFPSATSLPSGSRIRGRRGRRRRPSDGDVAPSDTPVSVDVPVASEPVTFTLVPGEPVVIPASQITIIPSAKPRRARTKTSPSPSSRNLAPVTTDESTRSAPISIPDPAATTCDASGAFACGGDSDSSADPLGSTRVRGSFQLLRARDAETGGRVAESLTLLRPGDETTEIFVTGTLINANADAVCLTDLEVPFDFPRTVARRPGKTPSSRPPRISSCSVITWACARGKRPPRRGPTPLPPLVSHPTPPCPANPVDAKIPSRSR